MVRTKHQRILDAIEELHRATRLKDPHLRIKLPNGLDERNSEHKAFMKEIKTFILAYKKFYGLTKIEVEFDIL